MVAPGEQAEREGDNVRYCEFPDPYELVPAPEGLPLWVAATCGKPALIGIKAENTPRCLEHFQVEICRVVGVLKNALDVLGLNIERFVEPPDEKVTV